MIFFIVFAKHKRADFLFDMTAPVTFASDTSSHLIILREKNKNQTTRAGFCLTFEQVCGEHCAAHSTRWGTNG